MSEDDNQRANPKSAKWVRRLKRSVGPESDPIRRLAQHAWGEGSDWTIDYDPQYYGSLEFALPESWHEDHLFLPSGLFHAEHGCKPFGPELEGGGAIVLWLKQSARMHRVDDTHARQVLEKRAASMATALAGKFDIKPLEMRVYYPPAKVSDRIRGTDHDCCAAIILATTGHHAKTLSTKVLPHILAERTKAEAAAEQEKHLPKRTPSRQGVLEILGECNQSMRPVPIEAHDIVTHILGLTTVSTADDHGRFNVEIKPVGTHPHRKILVPRELLKIPAHATALLTIPMTTHFTTMDRTKAKDFGDNTSAHAHDLATIKSFAQQLGTEIGYPLVARLIPTRLGADFLVLTAEGKNQYKTLLRATRTIDRWERLAAAHENYWRSYLDERHIEHTPPTHMC